MADTKYNGWTNRDTWAAHLWLTSYESTYEYATAAANVAAPRNIKVSIFINLLQELDNPDDIQYRNVDWAEVIAALKED